MTQIKYYVSNIKRNGIVILVGDNFVTSYKYWVWKHFWKAEDLDQKRIDENLKNTRLSILRLSLANIVFVPIQFTQHLVPSDIAILAGITPVVLPLVTLHSDNGEDFIESLHVKGV